MAVAGATASATSTFLSLDLQFHTSSPTNSSSSSSSSSFPKNTLFRFSLISKPCHLSPFLCHSTKSSPNVAEPQQPAPPSSNNPSLSDQLRPLSLTLLKEQQQQQQEQTHLLLSHKPKSTWVNPSRPKPKVLSLQRHKRSPYTYNPELKHLTLISRKLSECSDDLSAFSAALQEALPEPPSRENALLILNSLKPWQKAYQFFNWLKTQDLFPMETIFYNVTMKSLRFGKQYHLIEALAHEMIERGIELDNITYSTIITCAKKCHQFDKAIEWFESIYKAGLMPDEVTYSAILDVYAKLGKVEEVISLYERGRASGWKPDPVAFSVLGKMFGEAGDYDGIQYVLQEMKGLGVEPNLVVYNTLLEAMGRAGKPGLARSLFEEMVSEGLTPNEKTLTALIKIYGKARWSRDALGLWERMRLNHWPMDFILYNTLLSMCADLGLEEEAEKLFAEMEGSEHSRPDSWSYTAMINIYASGAKADKALELFGEMLENGVEPNVMSCTCLIQCLGKARRIEDAVRVFGVAMQEGVQPDDRLCGCLLSVVAFCEEGEMGKVLACLERANPRLVGLVKMLGDDEVSFDIVKEEFRGILNETAAEARRPFCNCLIDVCRNQKFPTERAYELFHLGTLYGLYPGLYSKISNEWCLNLRSLSIGAAHIAFEEWVKTLSSCVERKEALPQLFSVHTGTGTHKFSQGLANTFASHVKNLEAPFQQNEEKGGWFVASKEDLVSWVQARVSPAAVVK